MASLMDEPQASKGTRLLPMDTERGRGLHNAKNYKSKNQF